MSADVLPCGNACRDSEANSLAHVPAQLFNFADGKRGECKGGAGTHAARKLPILPSHIYAQHLLAKGPS
jgi:hypothetical protein